MISRVIFAKVREDAKIPTKEYEDAGLDIYASFDEDYIIINPHETKMISSGIISACDPEYCFILKERGSTGTKGIAQRCGVIDSGYRGEWMIPITNTNDSKPLIISKLSSEETYKKYFNYFYAFVENKIEDEDIFIFYSYTKAIAQAIVIPVPELDIEEWNADEVKAIPSKRGDGKLGSSGK